MRLRIALVALLTMLGLGLGTAPARADDDSSRLARVVVTTSELARTSSAAPRAALAAATSCGGRTVTMTGQNAFGGTLYKFVLTMRFCYDGSHVSSLSHNWSYSTGYGWSFDKWTNPPNSYYNVPYYTQANTVGQARFCPPIPFCPGAATPGTHIVGNANGSTSSSGL